MSDLANKFKDFSKAIEGKSKFLLIGHEQPDGDAIGALLSLYEFLREKKKKPTMVVSGNIPEIFSFLPNIEKIGNDFLLGDYEVIILVDNGDLKRTGFLQRITQAKNSKIPIINIDHHPGNDVWKKASINIADPKASSTCEIIYNLFSHIKYPLSPSVATSLLLGIYGDTGGFQHSNTSKNVMLIASELLKSGAKLKKITSSVSQSRSVKMLKLWGIAINNIMEYKKSGLIVSIISKEDIRKVGATEEEISGLVNLLNTAAESKASLLIYETFDGKIRGSLRTDRSDVDVAKFAKILGGGGHKKASGFSFEGKLRKTKLGWRIK